MLSRLKSLFGDSRRKPIKPPRAEPATEVTVLRAGRCADVLGRLRDARAILSVRIAHSDETFSSTLLKVSPNEGYLLLDDLVPRRGNLLLSNGCTVDVSAFWRGALVGFQTAVDAIEFENTIPLFKLSFPETVEYRQRRQYHRVALAGTHSVPVHLQVDSNQYVTGGLRNISTGGLCVLVGRQVSKLLNVGQTISRCVIDAKPDFKIVTGIEVRNAVRWTDPGFRRFGARFVDLDARNLDTLQRLVVTLDRQQARQRAH
jgi:c-di-GMP-binding flagellar brake protein YcgR